MSRKEPGMFYNMKKLNKIFAVLSFFFLIGVVWLVVDDYIRPWKFVQLKGMDVEKAVINSQIKEFDGQLDQEKLGEIERKSELARKQLESKAREIAGIESELHEVQKEIYVQNMENGNNSAFGGEAQFNYEHSISLGHFSKAKDYQKKLVKFKAAEAAGKDHLKALQAKEKELKGAIAQIEIGKTDAQKELDDLIGARNRMYAALKQTKKDGIFFARNAPFIDYLDPTLKVHQIVLDNITDDRYFQTTPKVDRCTTCHMFIDKPGFEDQAQPYRTHPDLDKLAVGVNSHHPIKDFGCTTCHQGEGHRVFDFNAPVHTPQNEEQAKEWAEKYHWHEPHKIPQPMFPLQFTEASCVKCHQGVERIPMATKLNEGRELIRDYGCYACHKIEGWQHLEKPGPALTKIDSKVSKEFIKNWIWAPHSFNPHSRMPSFFGQDNNSKPEFTRKNIAEVNAMAEYLVSTSKESKSFAKYTGGDADKGKELIQTVGCIACHQVEGLDDPFDKVKAMRAPYLTGTGSKVDQDWLVSWLIKPSHYQEDTVMPSFRLSLQEANDIATYLLGLKNEKFADLKFSELNKDVRDELLLGYFSQFEPLEFAKTKLAALDDNARTIELGRRSIGKYGCYSCHQIEGFAKDRAPIGPELTNEGSKPLTQFGYGLQHGKVGHTREAWLTAHLKNPRIWDVGVPKAFKDLNRMPNFYLTDDKVEKMVLALLGQVSDAVPEKGKKILSARETYAEEGKKVANKYNCYGCHKIDGQGGDLLKAIDPSEGPPWLVNEGHRVKTDWFYNFLYNVYPIRPWVHVRMPSFNLSDEEVNKLIAYFQAEADQPTFEAKSKVVWEPGEREAAVKMWDELACVSCHTQGFNQDEPQGPNLHNADQRLRSSWIKKWLTNPPAILEYTAMPDFWEGGKTSAVEGVLGDDPQKQIEAMVKYVQELGESKTAFPKPFLKTGEIEALRKKLSVHQSASTNSKEGETVSENTGTEEDSEKSGSYFNRYEQNKNRQ